MRPSGRRLGFSFGLCFGFRWDRGRSRRGGKVGISRFVRDFQGSEGTGENLFLVCPGFPAPVFSTALLGFRVVLFFSRAAVVSHHVRAVADRDAFIRLFMDRYPYFPPACCGIVFCRSASSDPLSPLYCLWPTTRSVCMVKIQFRSVRLVRRNAVHFSGAGTWNIRLNSAI